MTNFKKRLKEARKKKGYTQEALAQALELSGNSAVSNWEVGKARPTSTDLEKVANLLEVSVGWLLGDAENKTSYVQDNPPITTADSQIHYPTKRIPYYDDISIFAGQISTYQPNHESITDYIYIPEFSDCDASFPMFGDSMMSKLYPGEKLLCKFIEGWREDILPFGQIFVVFTDELRVVKYVKRSAKPNHFLLVSENEHYEPFDVPKSKIHNMLLVKGTFNRLVL